MSIRERVKLWYKYTDWDDILGHFLVFMIFFMIFMTLLFGAAGGVFAFITILVTLFIAYIGAVILDRL